LPVSAKYQSRIDLKYQLSFGLLNRVITIPTTGVSIKLRKNDHSSPIFRFLPIFSDTTSDRIYQAVNMMLNQSASMADWF